MKPTLRQLHYLLAVQDESSFSKAAERCFVSQSTLSAGIKELEMIVGQQLVNRRRKNITLTPLGQDIAADARAIENQIDSITAKAKRFEKPMSSTIKLGVIPTIAPYILPTLLPQLQKQYPDLDLQLYEDLTDHLLEKLTQGRIDAALMAFPYNTPGLEQHILFEEPFFLAHSTKTKPPQKLHIKDLEQDQLLLLEDGHCLREHALQACQLQPTQTRTNFSATSLSTLLQMVSHGYGMTLLPKMAADQNTLPRSIATTAFTDKTPPSRQIGLAWPINSALKRDLEILKKELVS